MDSGKNPIYGQSNQPNLIPPLEVVYPLDPITELQLCSSIYIKQEFEFLEKCCRCETPNRYLIFGNSPQGSKFLFKCREKSGCFMRNCCPANMKEFDMEINHIVFDLQMNSVNEFASFYKPCTISCFCFCMPEIFLTLKNGNILIGSIKQVYTLYNPEFEIYNSQKKLIFICTASCCQCGIFCRNYVCGEFSEAVFDIIDPKTQKIVGQFRKKMTQNLEELLSKVDNYELIFPMGINGYDKLLLTSLALMIDYQYFEIEIRKSSKLDKFCDCCCECCCKMCF